MPPHTHTHTLCLPDLLVSDKRLFETKRKDQLNALKNLVELNDINQQYKIIDIMLKGLFKVESWQHRKEPLYFSMRELFFLVAVKSSPWVGGRRYMQTRPKIVRCHIFGRCLEFKGRRLGMLAARQRNGKHAVQRICAFELV